MFRPLAMWMLASGELGRRNDGNDRERAQPGLCVHLQAARQWPLTFQSLYKWVQGGWAGSGSSILLTCRCCDRTASPWSLGKCIQIAGSCGTSAEAHEGNGFSRAEHELTSKCGALLLEKHQFWEILLVSLLDVQTKFSIVVYFVSACISHRQEHGYMWPAEASLAAK